MATSVLLPLSLQQRDELSFSDYLWINGNQSLTIGDEVFNGKFNLLNYPETFRGCLWPLILQFSKKFGMLFFEKDYMGFRVVMSLLLAILISVVFPTLFEKKVNSFKFISFGQKNLNYFYTSNYK